MSDVKEDSGAQQWEDKDNWAGYDGGGGNNDDCHAYNAQLMDTQEMQQLRTALCRSEMQIRQQGHLQEYVARKPSRAPSATPWGWYGLPRHQRALNRPANSAGPSPRVAENVVRERPKTSGSTSRPVPPAVKSAEFSRVLKEETRQVRELERRYQDTKRSLLEYIDIVTSCKPNDRVGGQEIYEQLADLLSFAAQCNSVEGNQ